MDLARLRDDRGDLLRLRDTVVTGCLGRGDCHVLGGLAAQLRQLLVEARLALSDLLHRLDRECTVDSQQGHLDRREARGHRCGGLLQRRDSGGLDLLDHHLVGRQARIGAFERKGPTFQQPELVLQLTQPCLGGHVGRVRCRSLLR